MKTIRRKSFVCLSMGFVLTLCSAVTASAQMGPPPPPPPPTNRLDIGGNYQIGPPPTNMNMMFQITNNETNNGDDNLVWSQSGRMLAIDRSDSRVPGNNKYICLLDVSNLGNVQTLGARSSAMTNPLFCNITGWTWNDDRVLFGWQPGNPPVVGKVRLLSCTATGAVSVLPFLKADPQADPTNHVYSPSVVFDPSVNKERLLFLVSSSTNNDPMGVNDIPNQPNARINLYTVPFDSGDVPSWADRVQLTAFNTNVSIKFAKWCPELGTNYQPICNRLVMFVSFPVLPPSPGVLQPPPNPMQFDNNRIVVFTGIQDVIADPDTAPTSLSDSRFIVVETNCTMNSAISWTADGQAVMYGRSIMPPPPEPGQPPPPSSPDSSVLYSIRADTSNNTAVIFEVPSSLSAGFKQWLCISPDGMKAAFTVNHKAYVIPMQFDNIAVTGAVVTNILTDASYTAVDVSGGAISSNQTISIVAPPSVDTNNFNGEFSGYARQFSVSGVSSQFDLLTNAAMTLHFSQSDIPSGASATNLAVYVYNPQAITAGGPTGTWTELVSVINTNSQTISCEVQHFSIYAIGRASAQSEPTQTVVSVSVTGDIDGDRLADLISVVGTNWYVWFSTSQYLVRGGPYVFNISGTPVTGDIDGDGLADLISVVGPNWYVWFSTSQYLVRGGPYNMGISGTPVTGDIDGDGLADLISVVGSNWYVWFSTAQYLVRGGPYDRGISGTPTTGDIDGDGLADLISVVGTNWYVWFSTSQYLVRGGPYAFNISGTPLTGDVDGDGLADIISVTGANWYVWFSTSQYLVRGGPYAMSLP